ncbi:MAG: M23 family metallopeptidase [Bacilli bacterium]|nr:M23 family metallopeptidase [Bacilli bacterium]
MEKALFPLKYMAQTQGVDGSYSHQGTYAIDYGNSGSKEKVYAPFTGIIKKIYTASGNAVWLESTEPVLFADGTNDYMTILVIHDDDVSSLSVGQKVMQGEHFYNQGKSGNATGIHLHLETAKGKFTDSGWYKNSSGIWMINNAIHPAKALFLTDDIKVVNDGGYKWQNLVGNPVTRDKKNNQIEVTNDFLRCRDEANGTILGYINRGIYNILDQKEDEYVWYKVDKNKWIAYDSSWATLYLLDDSLEQKILNLQIENDNLKKQVIELETSNESKFTYSCSKTGTYTIKLYKDETLTIK